MIGAPDIGWEWDLWVVLPLALAAFLYIRGVWLLWKRAGTGRGVTQLQALWFAAGWLTLVIALVSPLHEIGEHLFAAHMIEHELLMAVAAPLFAVSRPLGTFLHALPRNWRIFLIRAVGTRVIRGIWRGLMKPLWATILHAIAIWIWHVPSLLDATLRNENLHRLQHVSFLGTALIFWWSLFRLPRREYGAASLYIFATMVHTSILGALLTLAPSVLYPVQTAGAPLFGLTPLEDQQLAGLIMWVPGGALYLLEGLWLATLWLTSARENSFPGDVRRTAWLDRNGIEAR